MKKIHLILVVLLCAFSKISTAQRLYTNNNNLWIAYNGDHKFSKKLGLHVEYQERRNNLGAKNMQHLFRTGINYYVLPNLFVTAGYAYVYTYPYGAFAVKSNFPEHRIYQQLQYSTTLNRVEAVSRFRLEQRLSYLPTLQSDSSYKSANTSTYTNRFRYSHRFSLPLNSSKIVDKTFYITAFEEVFINFGKHVAKNIFDQNRAFVGFGYKVPTFGRIEAGYMNQMLFKGDGIKVENNQTFSISCNANFDLKKR
jgi:Protein of unknown function (DUF2490)